jgi:hypothetical protein
LFGSRSTTIILGVLVGALLLLGAVCGGWLLLHNSGNTAASPGSTPSANRQTTGQPTPTLTGPLIDNKCELAKGHTFEDVNKVLKDMGFKVDRQDVAGAKNRVVEITPCQAPKGATITVKVGNGKGGGGGGAPATSATGDNGGGGAGAGGGLPGPGCSLGMGGGLGCPSSGSSPSGTG